MSDSHLGVFLVENHVVIVEKGEAEDPEFVVGVGEVDGLDFEDALLEIAEYIILFGHGVLGWVD